MGKVFLKMQFWKKKWKITGYSPGLSLNEVINVFERSLCICLQSRRWHCDINMSHSTTNPTKWPVRRAKTQITLGICPVWLGPSLSAWRSFGSLSTHFVGIDVLRLNLLLCKSLELSLLLCKSINLRELILHFCFSFVGGARVGRGTGRMRTY